MGIGFVFSQLNLFLTYNKVDGKSGFSLQDLVLTYYGQPDVLLVESKLNGTMREHLENNYERNSLINWAKGGAGKEKLNEVKSIVIKKCLRCHTAGGDAAFAPFDNLSTVSDIFTRINRGISISRLITLSHIHIISIGVIFALSGVIFLFTPINEKLKMVLLIFPFGSLLMDMFSWWLTKLMPVFAITVFIGGVFTVIGFFIQFVISLLTMWKSSEELG
ncbi:aconitase A [Candidatus Scalindua japonica]|uniref:Aconitase A n=1 Tax=Candidatus Scalindua japonica TaxID=1284222 RepID=A0A286U3Z7_9BACT|nr:aconitase A [Candidatus Scalindua japonica]